MASQDYPQNYSVGDLELTCDLCNSPDIIETAEGYVCSQCGVVLEIAKMEYHRPYEEERVQHAVLGTTQIGHARERSRHSHSRKFHKLSKIHKSNSCANAVNLGARVVISRLLENLGLSRSLRKPIFTKYKEVREELTPGTKYRNPEKLVPGILYVHCKFNCIPVDETPLLEVSNIDKKDFKALILKLGHLLPKYYSRDRKQFIITRIMQIKEEYHLDMTFYHDAQAILEKLWEEIKCTKDDVIAGLVCSIVALCRYQYEVNVNSICNSLNIQMSTIQSQVKRRIFDRFRVPGFQSLVSSADILKDVVKKLGLMRHEQEHEEDVDIELQAEIDEDAVEVRIEEIQLESSGDPKFIETEEESEPADIVCIELDNVMASPLTDRGEDTYIFAIREEGTTDAIFISVSIPRPLQERALKPKKEHIEFQISRYHFAKGPPLLYA